MVSSSRKLNGSMTLAMPPANSVRNARAKTIKKLSESPNKIMPRKTATTSSQDSLGSGVEDSDGAGGSLNSKKWPTFNKNKVSSPIRISSKKNMGGLVAGSPVMNSESEALDSSLKLFSNVKVTDKVLKEIENSKSPRKPLKSSPLKRNFTPDANQEIVDGLRENFHRLSVLRSTEAETLLAQYRESAERRIAAGERLIEGLRQEKMQLLERLNNRTETHVLESRSTPVKRVSSAYSDISNSSQISLSSSGNVIALYECMSGVQIVPSDGDQSTWNCTISGRLDSTSEDIRSSLGNSVEKITEDLKQQYVYTPTFTIASSPIAHRLPAYLHEEICFDADQLQSFFWRALHFLMNAK